MIANGWRGACGGCAGEGGGEVGGGAGGGGEGGGGGDGGGGGEGGGGLGGGGGGGKGGGGGGLGGGGDGGEGGGGEGGGGGLGGGEGGLGGADGGGDGGVQELEVQTQCVSKPHEPSQQSETSCAVQRRSPCASHSLVASKYDEAIGLGRLVFGAKAVGPPMSAAHAEPWQLPSLLQQRTAAVWPSSSSVQCVRGWMRSMKLQAFTVSANWWRGVCGGSGGGESGGGVGSGEGGGGEGGKGGGMGVGGMGGSGSMGEGGFGGVVHEVMVQTMWWS